MRRELLTKRRVAIGVIIVAFLAMVVTSVVVQSATAWFVVLLALFAILVIGLAPWVLGE